MPENSTGRPKFWKSLKEFNNDPEIQELKENEFIKGAADDFDMKDMSGLSRRRFLALMGASAAFAATACTNYRDKGLIVPYNKKPEEITIGVPDYYASACTECENSCGILVKTREGRPIKVDGNPEHPVNKGKICNIGHGSIYNLYDPERLQHPLKNKSGKLGTYEWVRADKEIISALETANQTKKEIAFVTGKITSPSFNNLLTDFKTKYPTTKVYSYEYFGDENRNAAWQAVYGSGTFPLIRWNEAKVILALEGDFLCSEGHHVENARLFSEGRNADHLDRFNRLYAAEGSMTATGMNADYRLKINPAKQYEFVMSLLNEVYKGNVGTLTNLNNFNLEGFARANKLRPKVIAALVNDLTSNRGAAIVYAGDSLPQEVHIAVNLLNEALGNTKLYDTTSANIQYMAPAARTDIEGLIGNMNVGNVGVLIHIDTNPVYHLPQDYGYRDALKRVPNVITISEMKNETAELSNYVLPMNHYLESWGDHKTRTGVITLQQPVINTLYYTRQKEAILLNWLSGAPEMFTPNIYHTYLMAYWQKEIYPTINSAADFNTFWVGALHDGYVKIPETSPSMSPLTFTGDASGMLRREAAGMGGYTVVLRKSHSIGDGKYANNGWLQELPHPVSKIVWDNYAAISYNDSKELKLEDGDVVDLQIGSKKITLPILVQPGQMDKVISIELGYGRTSVGTVGNGIGTNAGLLMTKTGGYSNWIYTGTAIKPTGGKYQLASTHQHYNLNDSFYKDQHKKRDIIRTATLVDYKNNPKILKEPGETPLNIYTGYEYPDVKWGMAIDMNKCIGCGECVMACMVENNIPVVGKEQVLRGREMQWIRIDRYYSGTPDEPQVSLQTMLCQHCDNAPCEPVCPVNAATHSTDGLNQMVYNRCVGTRYCSNNCPYKVRRFNYFDFRDHLHNGYYKQDSVKLAYNPEVTVRSRGVMEKCTFCVQRISAARQDAVKEGRKVKGSDVTTACQDACPTNAIVFGDLNDPNSEVSKLREHNLGYHVFYEFNFMPNVTYISKLKNINPEEA